MPLYSGSSDPGSNPGHSLSAFHHPGLYGYRRMYRLGLPLDLQAILGGGGGGGGREKYS